MKATLLERFSEKYMPEPMSGCWLWIAAIDPAGYGRIGDRRKVHYAHRVSYQAHKGPIPAGLDLDHKCRVRSCVNPDHLEAVTHLENIARGDWGGKRNSRKTHCPQGHEYTPENTIVAKPTTRNPFRTCRICRNKYVNALRRNQRRAVKAKGENHVNVLDF